MPPAAATRPSMPASTRCAASPARSLRAALSRAAGRQRDPRARTWMATRVQDPYCLRCQPQVTGACLDLMRHAAQVLEREANAVTDNPLVSPTTATSSPAAISTPSRSPSPPMRWRWRSPKSARITERRIALLIDPRCPACRPSWCAKGGLNSGFMLAQVTAAALARENSALAHPRQRRQPADQRQPGGPCQHGDRRRAPPARHGRQHGRHRRRSNCWPPPRASNSTGRCNPLRPGGRHGLVRGVAAAGTPTASWRPTSRPRTTWWPRVIPRHRAEDSRVCTCCDLA